MFLFYWEELCNLNYRCMRWKELSKAETDWDEPDKDLDAAVAVLSVENDVTSALDYSENLVEFRPRKSRKRRV